MSEQLPSREELERLKKLHKVKGLRGPIPLDREALGRVQRMIDRERPRYRQIIKPLLSSELPADELSDAIADVVANGAIVRKFRSGLIIESNNTLFRDRVPLCQSIAADLLQLLSCQCQQCKSNSIQVQQGDRPPGWKLLCRACSATVRRPRSVC